MYRVQRYKSDLKSTNKQPRHRNFNRPPERQIPDSAPSFAALRPSEATLNKLQSFAFKPTNSADRSSQEVMAEVEHPATPMPQKIPLSDLMSNTPKRQETVTDESPEDKVVWKLTPKKAIEPPTASQESQNDKMTTFLSLLKDDDTAKKVVSFTYDADIDGLSDYEYEIPTSGTSHQAGKFISANAFHSTVPNSSGTIPAKSKAFGIIREYSSR